jgi:hypothetical protein
MRFNSGRLNWSSKRRRTMRWEGLFADLEAQADYLEASERAAEIDERTRIEQAQLTVLDRLRPTVGSRITLWCRGGLAISGAVRRVNSHWILIAEAADCEALVSVAALTSISGLGRLSAPADDGDRVESQIGLRQALRRLALDRSVVRVYLHDGAVVTGTLDRVGADFVEIALHTAGESRRRSEVREMRLLVISAIAVVRREPG